LKKVVIAIVLILLALGGYYYFSRSKGAVGVPGTGGIQKFSTLKAAIDLGVPLKCSYSVNGNEYEGYVKGKQWRGKIKTAEGQVGEVIMKDNCMWSWGNQEKQGMKTCFEETEDGDVWDQDTTVGIEYNCMPAAVTDAEFTPPADIQFMDLDQMMQQYGQ